MRKIKDLTGARFGRLQVIARAGKSRFGARLYRCLCDCGTERIVQGRFLTRDGGTQSCGCLRHERSGGKPKHGQVNTAEYRAWQAMKSRCYNRNTVAFANYGGRGIKVHPSWRRSFVNFFRDVGPKPSPAHTLGRKDNDGDYEPGNVEWQTVAVQNKNRRKSRSVEVVARAEGEWIWRGKARKG